MTAVLSEQNRGTSPFPFLKHPHALPLLELLEKKQSRFPGIFDEGIYNDLCLLLNLATPALLDCHSTSHVLRLLVGLTNFRIRLLRDLNCDPHARHVIVKFLPSHLAFPFVSKVTLGCLIGLTLKNPQELVTEASIEHLIEKLFPEYRLVPGMTYLHPYRHPVINLIYFELEKKCGEVFTLSERRVIQKILTEKLSGSLPRFIHPIFSNHNREDIYKNILLLSQEIESTQDIPHLMISLERQEEEEVVFSIIMTYASPKKLLNLEAMFEKENPRVKFVTQSHCPVTVIQQGFPLLAHVFHLHLPTHQSFFRTDGTLHYYTARKHVADLIRSTIGEFRDCNGGPIVKLEEQLSFLKDHFKQDQELIETIFYSILPLKKETTLTTSLLHSFFAQCLKALEFHPKHKSDFYFQTTLEEKHVVAAMRLPPSPYQPTLRASFERLFLTTTLPLVWSMADIRGTLSITALIEAPMSTEVEIFLASAKEILDRWGEQVAGQRVCRVALSPKETPTLDPRLGTDDHSSNVLRMLFEGLTRLGQDGKAEGGVAESIAISSDGLEYLFKLRHSFWNDGSPLSAHDFLYAWQKVLSPEFDLSFAYLFYPILNAQDIKEGRLEMDQLGAFVIDDHQLKIRLKHPVPYFLELLAHPIFSPVNRKVDQLSPYWTTQLGLSYPCNGPFQLLTSHPHYGYQLVKNPKYWDLASCPLDQIVFLCINSHEEARSLFQQGEIDILGYPFTQFMPLNGPGEIYTFPEKSSVWCLLNNETFPFNELKFRQALKYATNSPALFSALALNAEFTSSPLSPNLSSLPPILDYDPAKAKRLFHEFLEEHKMKLEELLPITIVCSSKTVLQKIAYQLRDCWTEVLKIRCRVEEGSVSGLYQRYKQGDFHVGLLRWISYFHDPSYILNAFRYSAKVVNFPRWTNPEYQCLLDRASLAQEGEQQKLLKKAEEILRHETPVIPLLHAPHICLKRPGADLFFFNRCGFVQLTRPLA
jgi:oligopeptide transport system substrate-binding protein